MYQEQDRLHRNSFRMWFNAFEACKKRIRSGEAWKGDWLLELDKLFDEDPCEGLKVGLATGIDAELCRLEEEKRAEAG